MEISGAIDRFEAVVRAAWPEQYATLRPGLDDAGIEELRSALAPWVLPSQVEQLYRWRGGGDTGVFGGWRMRPVDDLLAWHAFTTGQLGDPGVWLPVFEDEIVSIVTLDVPGRPPSDPSVWYGQTHDGWVCRLVDSLAALLEVVCDAVEAGAITAGLGGRLVLESTEEALDGHGWSELRLHRCPGAFRWPDPPAGTLLNRMPDPAWPGPWLAAVGVDTGSLTPRGATHTIAELVASSASGPVSGTIRGRVVSGSGGSGWWDPVVRDGSGELVVHCDSRVVPIVAAVGQDAEFDVDLASPDVPEPVTDDDPLVAAVANRLRPALPVAVARASRPL